MEKNTAIHSVEMVRQIREAQARLLEGKSDEESSPFSSAPVIAPASDPTALRPIRDIREAAEPRAIENGMAASERSFAPRQL